MLGAGELGGGIASKRHSGCGVGQELAEGRRLLGQLAAVRRSPATSWARWHPVGPRWRRSHNAPARQPTADASGLGARNKACAAC